VLDVPGLDADSLRAVARVRLIGCGTSYHAALVARCAIEEWARLPVEVEIASEYRYPQPRRRTRRARGRHLAVGRDRRHARGRCASRAAAAAACWRSRTWPPARPPATADATLLTHAGTEVGVAATKTFVSQVTALQLLALAFAQARGALPLARRAGLADELRRLPDAIERALVANRPADARDRGTLDARPARRLPRPPHRPAGRDGGRAEAQGDHLRPQRRVRVGRDEARADRADLRAHAGAVRRDPTPS